MKKLVFITIEENIYLVPVDLIQALNKIYDNQIRAEFLQRIEKEYKNLGNIYCQYNY